MQNYQNKINGLLGLASKAGKLAAGADAVKELIIKRKAYLVILAEDLSQNSTEKFQKLSNDNNIPVVVFGNIESNSKAIGKENKAIIAIKDKNFSDAISRIISGGDTIE